MSLSTLALFIRPRFGRRSGSEAAAFGRSLTNGFGFIGVGPVVVLFDLPKAFRKPDRVVEPISLDTIFGHLPSLEDLNKALRDAARNSPTA